MKIEYDPERWLVTLTAENAPEAFKLGKIMANPAAEARLDQNGQGNVILYVPIRALIEVAAGK